MAWAIQLGSAFFAFLAAIAWALSAIGNVPPPSAGWGGPVPSNDPFIRAFNRSVLCNRWGAGMAALSAALSVVAVFAPA